MTQLSPAEAVRQFDVSKPTLYSDMNDGQLSYTLDDRNRRRLDVAELQRLYSLRRKEVEEGDNVRNRSTETNSDVRKEDTRLELLQQEIKFMKRELENRREEVTRWQDAFEKAQETAQKVTLLLEDKSQNGAGEDKEAQWQSAFKTLEERLANKEAENEQKIVQLRKQASQRVSRLKQELETERAKTFWQKLFG